MSDNPSVILSGFADEAANQKTVDQQFSAFAAIGLQYYTIRFIDAGNGVKNVMKLNKTEVKHVKKKMDEYGLKVSSLGSPIGKVKLLDVDDGTHNAYIPFKKYLKNDVQRACDLANEFGTKLMRGFAFYHPRGEDPYAYVDQVVDQLSAIAELCDKNGITFGLEVEANLVGQCGRTLELLHRRVKHPAMLTIFDAANIVTQGYSSDDIFLQYHMMKKGLGWMHIKDYRHPEPVQRVGHVDEEAAQILRAS